MLGPIRALLSPKAAFVWEATQQEAFEAVIKELTCPRMLATFDAQSALRLETDTAQSRGLGMALWQQKSAEHWRLPQYGSRHVINTESRYSATEIDFLAVVWAVNPRLFLLGAEVELVDYRPVIPNINSKTLDELTSPRIVRMKERVAPFHIIAV